MALQGAIPVEFGQVFPHGAFALGVEPVNDFESGKPARDKATNELMWAVDVIDADPEARGKAKSVKVKVIAPVCPVSPEEVPGVPFRPIEFDGLTATPWVEFTGGKDREGNPRTRINFSLKAKGARAPGGSVSGGSGRRSASAGQSAPAGPAAAKDAA
jgi:hypothetical protein